MTLYSPHHTVRWGIIGCGDVTEKKSGPAFQKATGSALVAVMRRSGDLAKDYAARHGVPRWYDDADALVNDGGVDAVYVATPPGSHLEHALRAANAGKPVYVEKPMALDRDECREMYEGCLAARGGRGVPLYVAYYRRALPRFLRVKRLIEDGAIGTVRTVQHTLTQPPTPAELAGGPLPWRVDPAVAGGGKFVDLASHALDLFDFLFGPIADVAGRAANQAGLYPAEDVVAGTWAHAGGVVGTGLYSFAAAERVDRCEVVGSAGTLTFQVMDNGPIELKPAGGGERQTFHEPDPEHVQQPLIQTVVDDLRGVGTCPSTGESAWRATWAIDKMLAGYRAARA
ncbi:MAG: oxidoreductase domain protein [Phycisphaerales bacterium]|nr:oxidoreductase domain protein [Phycisphaerales bacterium]